MVKRGIILTWLAVCLVQLLDRTNGTELPDDPSTAYIFDTGLYDENDSVISLNGTNLKAVVFEQPHASMVQIYNKYCGFCREYAPIWKQLANDILGWQRFVKVHELDCFSLDNEVICRKLEVMTYPTVRFFAPYYKDGPQQIGEPIAPHANGLIDTLVEHMQNVTNRPPGWPDFSPIDNDTPIEEFFIIPKCLGAIAPKYAYIINENEPNGTTVGSQVILDFQDMPHVVVKRTKNTLEPSGVKAIVGKSMSVIKLPIDQFSRAKVTAAIQQHLTEMMNVDVELQSNNGEQTTDQSNDPH